MVSVIPSDGVREGGFMSRLEHKFVHQLHFAPHHGPELRSAPSRDVFQLRRLLNGCTTAAALGFQRWSTMLTDYSFEESVDVRIANCSRCFPLLLRRPYDMPCHVQPCFGTASAFSRLASRLLPGCCYRRSAMVTADTLNRSASA